MSDANNLFEGYLSEKEFCVAVGKTPRTVRLWRKRRYGPAYVRVGKAIFYPIDDARAWLRNQLQLPVRGRLGK